MLDSYEIGHTVDLVKFLVSCGCEYVVLSVRGLNRHCTCVKFVGWVVRLFS